MITSNNFDKNSPIAFFDSGVGGLTVLNKLKKLLPYENYLYYGDTAHMPYGEKTKAQLLEYSDNILKFFENKRCKAVVMACNTTSSVIYDEIKNKYNFKLFPVVQSVAEILAHLPVKKLGVFATRATIDSGAYKKNIKKYNPDIDVCGQYCPQWVHIVEENTAEDNSNIQIIKSDLDKMLENNPEKIVLGCTHYPFLLDVLSQFAPREMFIDPALDFAKKIKQDLEEANLINNDNISPWEEFYVSANPELFKESAQMFYSLDKVPYLKKFEVNKSCI